MSRIPAETSTLEFEDGRDKPETGSLLVLDDVSVVGSKILNNDSSSVCKSSIPPLKLVLIFKRAIPSDMYLFLNAVSNFRTVEYTSRNYKVDATRN